MRAGLRKKFGSSPLLYTNLVMNAARIRKYRVADFNTSPAELLTEVGFMVRMTYAEYILVTLWLYIWNTIKTYKLNDNIMVIINR